MRKRPKQSSHAGKGAVLKFEVAIARNAGGL